MVVTNQILGTVVVDRPILTPASGARMTDRGVMATELSQSRTKALAMHLILHAATGAPQLELSGLDIETPKKRPYRRRPRDKNDATVTPTILTQRTHRDQ